MDSMDLEKIIQELRKRGYQESYYLHLYTIFQHERMLKERYKTATILLGTIFLLLLFSATLESLWIR